MSVRGIRGGTAYIYATRNGFRSSCRVTVTKRAYRNLLTRSVSSGYGYVNVTAKTWPRCRFAVPLRAVLQEWDLHRGGQD